MYEYKMTKLIKVIDGDTIDAEISLGFGLTAKFRFRLAGVDTPELYGTGAGEAGKEAKAFVEQWFETYRDRTITVQTHKASDASVGIGDGAFGRWLGSFVVWNDLPSVEGNVPLFHDLALDLREAGHVK